MANQTITTTVNYDDSSISGLLNGETITNNGGFLTINSDVRWNQQAAVLGGVVCSLTIGGSVLIDGTAVWELTFTSSTGNVPNQGNIGTNTVTGGTSGATGELLRVWQTGSLTPITTGGGAMPATGWIKLRSKTGTFVAGEIVTLPGGATITISGAGKRSWLHIVGAETLGITAARVSGTCSMTGDWYDLGTTNGTDDQTFQFPVADYCPAIQIETAVGSGTYEWWLYADNRWGTATQMVATDVRGKYFGMNTTTGVITIARRATNSCGFKPASGLRVRVPNLICSSSSSANWNANTFSSTLTSRYRGIFTSGATASASFDKICCNWDLVLINGTNVSITNSACMPLRNISTNIGTTTIDNVAVGCCPVTIVNSSVIAISACNQLIVTNCRFVKRENDATGDLVFNFGTSILTLTNVQVEMFGTTGSAQRASTSNAAILQLSRCYASTITNLTVIGGSIQFNTFVGAATATNITFADGLIGTTQTSVSAITAMGISTCTNFTLNGPVSWFGGLANVQPFNTLISVGGACKNVVIQSIGTSASPLDLGNTAFSLCSVSDTDNLIVRRCYVQNTRGNVFGLFSITTTNSAIDNCGSDYADSTQITGNVCKLRGLKTNLGSATSNNLGTNIADMFTGATVGRIVFSGNDPAPTNPQLVLSGGSGIGTNGAGSIIMPNIGDTANWESQWFHLGHTALANSALTLTGTNTGNFNYDFQYDLGSGWNGTWLSATGVNLSGIGTINPSTGIKLKMRATVAIASSTNALSFISVITVTTSTAQDTLYPFPFDASATINNLISGSRIQIYNLTTSSEITNSTASGTTYSYSYYNGTEISSGDSIRIRIAKTGYLPQTLLAVAANTGFSATSNAQTDVVYNSNGIDGSTVTEFSTDYPNVQVDINDPDNTTSVKRLYAWMRYIETTSGGISQWMGAINADDEVNYAVDQSIANIKLDNLNSQPLMVIDGRLYRKDGSTVISATSNSIQMDPNRVYPTDALINVVQSSYDLMKITMALSA